MKTPLKLAVEHARAYVRNRGWRVEPLSWEEVAVLVDELDDMTYWASQVDEEAS